MSRFNLFDGTCYNRQETEIFITNNFVNDILIGNAQENNDCWLDSNLYSLVTPLDIRKYFLDLLFKMQSEPDQNIQKICIYISNYISKFDKKTKLSYDNKQKFKFLILKYIVKYLLKKQKGTPAHTSGDIIKLNINVNNHIKCKLNTGNTDWLNIFLSIYSNEFAFQMDTKEGCFMTEISPHLHTCLTRRFNDAIMYGLLQKAIVMFNINHINNSDNSNKVTDVEKIIVNGTIFKLQSIIITSNNHYTVIVKIKETYYYYDNQKYKNIKKLDNINAFFLSNATKNNPLTFIYSNTSIIPEITNIQTPTPPTPTPPTPPTQNIINSIIPNKINFICVS